MQQNITSFSRGNMQNAYAILIPMETASNSTQHIYNLDIDDALMAFDTTKTGLTTEEAIKRQKQYGLNSLPQPKSSFLKRLIEPFSSVFVLVLLFALGLSMYEQKTVDAIIIAVIVCINAIIYYFQQFSVSRVLKNLRQHDVSVVFVRRDEESVELQSEYLTYGDIIHVQEGMKLPADGRIVDSAQLEVDESMLTGESLPVHKHAAAVYGDREVYDQRNMLFKGTYVRSGSALMMVTGIGVETQLGTISNLALSADGSKSPVEKKIDRLTKRLIAAIIIFAIVALNLSVYRGVALDEALRFSLVIVVSAVPEGLPIALSIVVLFSARRMARSNALVKKLTSIETMGALTMIATDKTGTITQNKLSIADMHTTHNTKTTFHEVVRASLNGDTNDAGDPLDVLLHGAVMHVQVPSSWQKEHEFAFNQQLRISGVLWRHSKGYSLYIKGAPENVLSHCSVHHRQDEKIIKQLDEFTHRGHRTIAFAHINLTSPIKELHASTLQNMFFDGFVGMADSLRPEVYQAVADAQTAGVKVVMLTGDHVNTARYIAKQVGIVIRDQDVVDSRVIQGKNEAEIREMINDGVRVFGRVLPEHKFALLKAIKGYEITAMTGDGVNDIPALVEADAGIAMGSGTDAAKDASDIVLLDNNFSTIVSAMKVGRTVLANIRKMLVYLLGTSGGETLTMITALILNIPLPVTAIQILWINLVTDGVSVIPLGLSPPEKGHVRRAPRSPRAPILSVRQLSWIVTMAVLMCVIVLYIFKSNLPKGHEYAQTLAFMSLIVMQWANALNVNIEFKSWAHNFITPNRKLLFVLFASAVVQIMVFMTPLGQYLDVVPVMVEDAFVAIVMPVFLALLASDIHKAVWNIIHRRQKFTKQAKRDNLKMLNNL